MGKVFGGLCAILGVFTLTLPIPIVVNSFAGFYKNRLWRNEVKICHPDSNCVSINIIRLLRRRE